MHLRVMADQQPGVPVGNGRNRRGSLPGFPRTRAMSFWRGPSQSAHNGWMLVSCALVLFMTAPGLALFYGGLVRKKNVLSVLMQCIFLMGLMTVLWALYGYSLAFGSGNPYFGDMSYLFMHDVGRSWNEVAGAPRTPMFSATSASSDPHVLSRHVLYYYTCALFAVPLQNA